MADYIKNYTYSSILSRTFPVTYDALWYSYMAATYSYKLASYVVPQEVLLTTTAALVLPPTVMYGYKTYKVISNLNNAVQYMYSSGSNGKSITELKNKNNTEEEEFVIIDENGISPTQTNKPML